MFTAHPLRLRRANVSEPGEILWSVTETLERLDIPYLVTGSFASTIHGIIRATGDADLLADVHLPHVPFLVQAFRDTFYI